MYPATVTIGSSSWSVQVASGILELAQGYSNVQSTPANSGILFDLGSTLSSVTVNMQEMLFPLDIIFFDGSQKVIGIMLNMVPGIDGHFTDPGCRYFMEVNVGEATGVSLNDQATMTGLQSSTGLGIDMGSMINMMIIIMMIGMMMKMMGSGNEKEKSKAKLMLPNYT